MPRNGVFERVSRLLRAVLGQIASVLQKCVRTAWNREILSTGEGVHGGRKLGSFSVKAGVSTEGSTARERKRRKTYLVAAESTVGRRPRSLGDSLGSPQGLLQLVALPGRAAIGPNRTVPPREAPGESLGRVHPEAQQ